MQVGQKRRIALLARFRHQDDAPEIGLDLRRGWESSGSGPIRITLNPLHMVRVARIYFKGVNVELVASTNELLSFLNDLEFPK